jgi:hypothetical protein
MHDDFIAFADCVADRIAVGCQQISVFDGIHLTEYSLIIQQQISDTAGFFVFKIAAKFIPPPQWQLPGVTGGSAMTIGAFNLNVSQQGAGDIAVAVC